MTENQGKPSHAILGNYKHLFTEQFIKQAKLAIQGKSPKPIFMRAVPGVWSESKDRLQYTDEVGVKRTIVPQTRVDKFLQVVYENPSVMKGQASMANWIADRYIGVAQLRVREFVAAKAPLQMMRDLQTKPTGKQRIVRPKTPFVRVSADLGDMVSFTKLYNDDDGRYFLVVVCDLTGYIYAERLDGKSGKDVAKSMRKILKKIRKINPVRTINSDKGTDFHNPEMRALLKEFNIVHIGPGTKAKIAPTAELAVRHVKRMVRINHHILQKVFWWEVLRESVSALNTTRKREGFTARQLVRSFRDRGKDARMLVKFRGNKRADEQNEIQTHLKQIEKGDYIRLRIVPDKLPKGFKSHLGFIDDEQTKPNSWSTQIYRVDNRKYMRVNRKFRYHISKGWFDRYEMLLIPAETVNEVRREKTRLPILGKRPEPQPVGRRSGRRKKIDYSKYY